MTRPIRLLARALPLALFLLVPALLFAAQREPGARAPAGAAHFVDSGQALGDAASRDVALGDVDNDGDLDALVVNGNANLTLWLNEGGVFTASDQDLGGYNGNAVALADLDGDGDLDAVAVLNAAGDALRILINQGPQEPGVFASNGQTFTGVPNEVAIGDVNGDGAPDLFLTSAGAGNQVWFNDGGSPVQFTNSDQLLGDSASQGAALGDLDGDGDLDAVVANTLFNEDAANEVWSNQGGRQNGVEGIFAHWDYFGADNTLAVALGDVDRDGALDVLAVNSGVDRLWRNQGNGTFFGFDSQELGDGLGTDGALADLDADGDLDAFISNIGSGNSVWLNQGDGSFVDSGQQLGDASSYGVALGDVDGDGSVDAFVANNGPNRVWLNQASPPGTGADVLVSLPPTAYHQTVGDSCLPGPSTFVVTVHNIGPEPATNVTVHTHEGEFDWPLGSPTYNFGTLMPNESATVELGDIPRRPADSGTIFCIAAASVRVTADQDDPNPDNNDDQSEEVWYHCDDLCSLETIFCQISPPDRQPSSLLQALQETSIDLLVYYYVRDGVLASTGDGQHYIDLYETHDAEIKGLLEADGALADEGIATLQLWEPNLWAMVRGKGDSAMITAEQVSAVDSFLESLSDVASPALQQTIAAERDRLPPPEDFVGMTMEEARGMVVGYGVYLPAVRQ